MLKGNVCTMIPLGKGLATEAAKVPSGYLRRMSGKMMIPSHCIRLMDCVGQGEVCVQPFI